MSELGVRDELAVEEKSRADPRPEREHDHDAAAIATGAIAHLGQSGGVGVVDHVHRAVRRLGEHGVDVRADPCLVDVRRRAGDAAADDGRKGNPDVAIPVEVVDELGDDVGHRLRGCRLGGRDLVAFARHGARGEVDGRRFHARSADVDAERQRRPRAHEPQTTCCPTPSPPPHPSVCSHPSVWCGKGRPVALG